MFSLILEAKKIKVEILAPPEPPPLAQKPILVGVTIDTQPRASIIDPTVPQGRDRRAQIKRIGDVYQGYTITEISPERMVLESGTRKEIIPLHEGTKRGQQGKTPILSTRVVPFGGGGITGGTPISVSGGPGAAPPRTRLLRLDRLQPGKQLRLARQRGQSRHTIAGCAAGTTGFSEYTGGSYHPNAFWRYLAAGALAENGDAPLEKVSVLYRCFLTPEDLLLAHWG